MELYIPHVIIQTQTKEVYPLNSFSYYSSLDDALNVINEYILKYKTLFAYIEKDDGEKKNLVYYKCYMDSLGNVPYFEEIEKGIVK